MTLQETISQQMFNETIATNWGFGDDLTNAPDWIVLPLQRWYDMYKLETAINDNTYMMGYKLSAILARYRDRIMVRYKQYTVLIDALENPGLTSNTTSTGTTANNGTTTTTSSGSSTLNDKYSEGIGGGDTTNQSGRLRYNTDLTTNSESANSKDVSESTQTNNLTDATTTTDVYMKLEGLKHDATLIFNSLYIDLTNELLINVW